MLLKLGSRSSALAKIQTHLVAKSLNQKFPDLQIQFHFKESKGDKDLHSPLWKLSGQGIFTKDLQDDLLNNKIDGIVHSWKDLDLSERKGTRVISVLPREDQRDVIFLKKSIDGIFPSKIKILTSSPRREYNIKPFIRSFFPISLSNLPIEFESVRGNIQTRFKKFMESDSNCLLVAKAAIDRILTDHTFANEIDELIEIQNYLRSKINECLFMILPLSQNPCAPAQGALCVETRENDQESILYFESLMDLEAEETSKKERNILQKFGGGCHQKIGVSAIAREFGEITYLRGETDSGKVLNEITYSNKLPIQFSEEEVWPYLGIKPKKDRIQLSVAIPNNTDLYISKSFSLPATELPHLKNRILWCSGVSTWKELAKRDIWVHGSSDGLGEVEKIQISCLTGRENSFLKLTHDTNQNQVLPTLKTYVVSPPDIPYEMNPKQIKAAFWNSGSEFLYLMEKFPEWKYIIHFCGPGSTYLKIKQYLGEKGKINICPSFQYWKDYYIKN